LRLAVERFAVVRFLEPPVLRLAALVFLRVVRFREVDLRLVVPFRRLVAAAFLAARDLAAVFRFRVAAAFLAAVVRLREVVVRFRVVRLRVVLFRVATMRSPPFTWSGRHALQASPLSFAHASPHAVPLVATQRVVEALDPNLALGAYALRLARGTSLLGEEDLRVELPASRPLLPGDVVVHPLSSRPNYIPVILTGRTTFVQWKS
jgi:hypothetical protein